MNTTFDAVFSVKDLKKLLKAAQASQKAHNAKTRHCIVLRGLTVGPSRINKNPVLCSVSFWESVHNLEKSTAEYLSVMNYRGDK